MSRGDSRRSASKCNRLSTQEASGTERLEKTESFGGKKWQDPMQQSGTHTVPSTVLSARDKDSCILSFGTQVMIITKYRDFSEVKFASRTDEKISVFKLVFTESYFVSESVLNFFEYTTSFSAYDNPMKEMLSHFTN